MAEAGLAALYAIFLWWFSTGLALALVSMPERTHRYSMAGVSVVSLGALWVLWITAQERTELAAYCSFTAAILVWAWHEVSFLTGYVTGVRKSPCPSDARGWRRAMYATGAILYHELAIILGGILVIALSWNAENWVGACTYVILWVMRISAKLNIFLGVPNLTDEFLPPRLEFLKSYFRQSPVQPFFPISVTAATIVLGFIAGEMAAEGTTQFELVAGALVGTLMALAILEHWFLVLPLPDAILWRWAVPAKSPQGFEPADGQQGLSAAPASLSLDRRTPDVDWVVGAQNTASLKRSWP